MKPIALLFALIALCCAATLMLTPAEAQQGGATQTQTDQRQSSGKQRGYVTGNFAGDLDGRQTGLVPNAEAQQAAPSANLSGALTPAAPQQPPIVIHRRSPGWSRVRA